MRVVFVHDGVAVSARDQPAVDRDGECEGDEEAEGEARPEEPVAEAGGDRSGLPPRQSTPSKAAGSGKLARVVGTIS